MSYVLDGIKTAMTVDDSGTFTVSAGDGVHVGPSPYSVAHEAYTGVATCPCGSEWFPGSTTNERLASLRFHFTHCPQAKLPTPEDKEP